MQMYEHGEPSGSPKVETRPEYEVRITMVSDNKAVAFQLAEAYNKKFKVDEYLWSYELSEKKVPHIHGMVKYEKDIEPASSSRSDWMKRQIAKKQGNATSHHLPVEDELKYGAYVMKEGQYITNMSKEKIDEFLKRVAFVKEDKKKSAVQKLLERIKPALDAIDEYNSTIPEDDFLPDAEEKMPDICSGKNGKMINKSNVKGCQLMAFPNPNIKKNIVKKQKIHITLSDIAKRIIDVYHNEWNKDMQWSKLKQYTIYIADKCGHCGEEIKNNIEKLF